MQAICKTAEFVQYFKLKDNNNDNDNELERELL